MNPEKTFYMVWRQGTGHIHFQHEIYESARREAERLARATPSATFYVLRAVGYAEIPPPPSIFKELEEEIPF